MWDTQENETLEEGTQMDTKQGGKLVVTYKTVHSQAWTFPLTYHLRGLSLLKLSSLVSQNVKTRIFIFYLFIFLRFYLFIQERHTDRERQRHRQREKQAPCREPDVGLDPGPPGSRPGPKAGAEPLSHPDCPKLGFLNKCDFNCIFPFLSTLCNSLEKMRGERHYLHHRGRRGACRCSLN